MGAPSSIIDITAGGDVAKKTKRKSKGAALADIAASLGSLLGKAEKQWRAWQGPRDAAVKAVTDVRDRASALLSEIGSQVEAVVDKPSKKDKKKDKKSKKDRVSKKDRKAKKDEKAKAEAIATKTEKKTKKKSKADDKKAARKATSKKRTKVRSAETMLASAVEPVDAPDGNETTEA